MIAQALQIMLYGMLGIFAVMGILLLVVMFLKNVQKHDALHYNRFI